MTLYTEKDMVDVVDADGKELPAVPKAWLDTDLLPVGVKKKGKASKKADPEPDAGKQDTGGEKPDGEPAGNASADEWAQYARDHKDAGDADLLGDDGEPLGRDALRAKFGTPKS